MRQLNLSGSDYVGSGGMRDVYLHPQDSGKVVKVYKFENWLERQRSKGWYKRFQKAEKLDANLRDLKEHEKAWSKRPEISSFICQVFGIVPTSKGPGLVSEHVCDANGQTSVTLKQYVIKNGMASVQKELENLFDMLIKHHILFRDAGSDNILVQQQNEKFRLVIIEGLGEANFFPYSSLSFHLNKRKLERKRDRLIKNLSLL